MFSSLFGKTTVSALDPAMSFVKFDGTKLKLEKELKIPSLESVKVLSILGKARMGKSTFLNTIISKLTNTNTKVFNCQTGIGHCTIGIDYCFLPDHNLLLLDSQGLANGDAQHDPALLLFIYLISDVIIFNDSKILQNEALKLIEPICAFMTYIEDITNYVKPHLIFRLSDCELVKDTQENLDQVLAPHDDQYQSIRHSVVELFQDPISLVKTAPLDRNEKVLMESSKYIELLESDENLFNSSINTVLDILKTTTARPNILSKLSEIVELINTNSKISIDKLDVVALLASNEIMSWINEIDSSLYSPIKVDGTQETYTKNVEPRIAEVKKKIAAFKRRFLKVSPSLKNAQLKTLEAKLNEPIKVAQALSEKMAEKSIKTFVDLAINADRDLLEIKTDMRSLSETDDATIKTSYLSKFMTLQQACTDIVEPVKQKYDAIVKKVIDDFFKTVAICREQELAEKKLVIDYCKDTIDSFESWSTMMVDTFNTSDILIKNTDIIASWINSILDNTRTFIKGNIKIRSIRSSYSSRILNSNIFKGKGDISMSYDLIHDTYTEFETTITQLANSARSKELINEAKERLLEKKIFVDPIQVKKIYLNNPDIQFVCDMVLLDSMVNDSTGIRKSKLPYMTKRTWETVYHPLYMSAMSVLTKKGLCRESDAFHKYIISIPEDNIDEVNRITLGLPSYIDYSVYESHVSEMITYQMKKIYCKKIVEGFSFPTELQIIEPTVSSTPPADTTKTLKKVTKKVITTFLNGDAIYQNVVDNS